MECGLGVGIEWVNKKWVNKKLVNKRLVNKRLVHGFYAVLTSRMLLWSVAWFSMCTVAIKQL